MKIMVTGASGFLGSKLIKLLSLENEIIALTSSISGKLDTNKVHYIECSMFDYNSLPDIVMDTDIDICIHLAWVGNSGEKKGDYNIQIENVRYSLDLINSLSKMGVKRFVGIGSLAEYDVLKYNLMDNSTPNKSSMYGICKLSLHMLSKVLCISKKIEYIWCTLANVYGGGDPTFNIVNYSIDSILSNEPSNFTNGIQLYDLIYIDDAINGIYLSSIKGVNGCEYYIGSGNPRPLKEYLEIIHNVVNPSKTIVYGTIPFNGVCLDKQQFDISKIKEIGYVSTYNFENGLKITLANRKKKDL